MNNLFLRWVWLYAALYLLSPPLGGIALFVARHCLGFEKFGLTLGRGDTIYNYAQLICHLGLASALALVWHLADRRRAPDWRLFAGLRIVLRYWLASTMFIYGLVKVCLLQFQALDVDRLLQPLGQVGPMGLMWCFFSYSWSLQFLAGVAEVLCAFLLCFRRTALLGSLLGTGICLTLVVLNFCFDVPLKLLTVHLFGGCVFLLAPDLRRVWMVLTYRDPGPVQAPKGYFPRFWQNIAFEGVKLLAILGYLLSFLASFDQFAQEFRDLGKARPLHGVWRAPTGERLIFQAPSVVIKQTADGRAERYRIESIRRAGKNGGRVELNRKKGAFTYVREGVKLRVSGALGTLALTSEVTPPFQLCESPFRWVCEQPNF